MDISFPVEGYPPAKSGALSVVGAGHPHAPRVVALLEKAKEEIAGQDFSGFGSRRLGFELRISCPEGGNRSDATNYLSGVADALEEMAHRGTLEHVGDLAAVALYDNDRQIDEVHFYLERSEAPVYGVRFWSLED